VESLEPISDLPVELGVLPEPFLAESSVAGLALASEPEIQNLVGFHQISYPSIVRISTGRGTTMILWPTTKNARG
jgi:hypothetical protein